VLPWRASLEEFFIDAFRCRTEIIPDEDDHPGAMKEPSHGGVNLELLADLIEGEIGVDGMALLLGALLTCGEDTLGRREPELERVFPSPLPRAPASPFGRKSNPINFEDGGRFRPHPLVFEQGETGSAAAEGKRQMDFPWAKSEGAGSPPAGLAQIEKALFGPATDGSNQGALAASGWAGNDELPETNPRGISDSPEILQVLDLSKLELGLGVAHFRP